MSNGIIYIAGPMSGIEDYNYPAFDAAQKALYLEGWAMVMNPAETFVPISEPRKEHMRFALAKLVKAHAIYMLKGWKNSPGAFLEYQIALQLGMDVWFEVDGVTPAPECASEGIFDDFERSRMSTYESTWEMSPDAPDPMLPGETITAPPIEPLPFRATLRFDAGDVLLSSGCEPETVCQEAQRLTHGPRQEAYGRPYDNFTQIAQMMSHYLGGRLIGALEHSDVAVFNIMQKLSREANVHKRDNWVDIAGYANAAQMAEEQDPLSIEHKGGATDAA